MKHALSVLAAALLLSSAVANGDEPARNVVGSWQGTLDAGTARLRIVFNIARAAGGGLTATMDRRVMNRPAAEGCRLRPGRDCDRHLADH